MPNMPKLSKKTFQNYLDFGKPGICQNLVGLRYIAAYKFINVTRYNSFIDKTRKEEHKDILSKVTM